MIVDDYHFGACRLAIDAYRAEHGITAPLHRIDAMSVFWVKGEAAVAKTSETVDTHERERSPSRRRR